MYLTSMTHEELYAEVHKDLIEISTQANMFMDKVRKKTKNMLPYPLATQRITLTTTHSVRFSLELSGNRQVGLAAEKVL